MMRPTSLGIVCWLLIVLGVLGGLSVLWSHYSPATNPQVMALMARSPAPPVVQEAVGLLGCIVEIVAGVLMLRRIATGRRLYVVWGAFVVLFTLWTSPVTAAAIPSIAVYALIVFFLFRRPVSAWLRADAPL